LKGPGPGVRDRSRFRNSLAAISRTRSFIARIFQPLRQVALPDFDHRTKAEHLATILDPVAARDTKRDVVDGDAEIFKENNTEPSGPSLAEMAATEFRARFMSFKCLEWKGSRVVANRESIAN
jgi:hypothetical protein